MKAITRSTARTDAKKGAAKSRPLSLVLPDAGVRASADDQSSDFRNAGM
ncbi:MAG: hypothetical protein KKA12_05435 [Alphaproteobacteria bacterium]|nr:hypothetical protein [Alphaproteobacteria bacterium]